MLTICLITLGDPATLSGGYRYHRRMAELAGRNRARIIFASLPTRLPILHGRRALRAADTADVVLVDSIVAAFLAPWIAFRRPGGWPPSSISRPAESITHRLAGGRRPGWTGTFRAGAKP